VRRFSGAVLVLVAAVGVAFGGLWAFMKAAGAEVDICGTGEEGCTSGWYYAVPILAIALILGVVGVVLLRGEGHASRSGERIT
jgi:hypothetical protein